MHLSDDVKLNLCRSGFVEKLIGILDSWEGTDAGRNTEKQEGSIKVVELINDFIVLLLTGGRVGLSFYTFYFKYLEIMSGWKICYIFISITLVR